MEFFLPGLKLLHSSLVNLRLAFLSTKNPRLSGGLLSERASRFTL